MGGLCSSSAGTAGSSLANSLIGQYGEKTVLNYVHSIIGNTLLGKQFSSLRNLITTRFNQSAQAKTNPGLLDQIL